MAFPLNSYVETIISSISECDSFGDWVFTEVIKLSSIRPSGWAVILSHWCAYMKRALKHTKDTRGAYIYTHRDNRLRAKQPESSHLSDKERHFRRQRHCQDLDFGLQASRTVR